MFDLINKQAILIDNKYHLEWLMLKTKKLSIKDNIPENRYKTITFFNINNDLNGLLQLKIGFVNLFFPSTIFSFT